MKNVWQKDSSTKPQWPEQMTAALKHTHASEVALSRTPEQLQAPEPNNKHKSKFIQFDLKNENA